MLRKIIKYLSNDELYKSTLEQMFKDADIDDLLAAYSNKARMEFLKEFADIMEHYNNEIDIDDLISNASALLSRALQIGEMHRVGGTKVDYLLATVKTMLRCYEDMLVYSDIDRKEVLHFIINVRKLLDAREIVLIKHWFRASMEDVKVHNNELYTQLRQLYNRHKKVLSTLSYPAIIVNEKGKVHEMNDAAQSYFAIWNTDGKIEIMSLLDFHFATFDDFMDTYKDKGIRHLEFTNGDKFSSKLIQLNKNSYMMTLEPANTDPKGSRHKKEAKHSFESLTHTEAIVSQYVSQGMSSKQIANKLGLSEETVKTHRKNIRRKLGLVNRKVGLPSP